MAPTGTMTNRRFLVLLLALIGILCFTLALLSRQSDPDLAYSKTPIHHVAVDDSTLKGAAIMSKLGNETLKYASDKERGGIRLSRLIYMAERNWEERAGSSFIRPWRGFRISPRRTSRRRYSPISISLRGYILGMPDPSLPGGFSLPRDALC